MATITKERPGLDNHGLTVLQGIVRSEVRECVQHGSYQASLLRIALPIAPQSLREVWTTCPVCDKAKRAELAAQRDHEIEAGIAEARQRQLLGEIGIKPKYMSATLENYEVISESTQVALDAAKEYLVEIRAGEPVNLILLGDKGTGKTHLGCALAKEIAKDGEHVVCVTAADLFAEVRDNMFSSGSRRASHDVMARFIECKLLVLDEIGAFAGDTDFEHSVLFAVFDGRDSRELPTVVSGNLTREEMRAYLDHRSVDRLTSNAMVVQVVGESYRQLKRGGK